MALAGVKVRALLVPILVALGVGCGGGCPTSPRDASQERWAATLNERQPLALRPDDAISIKRDVHNLTVDVDAATLARAFHDVMRDPERRFGLIRVDRLRENRGKPFSQGEKFQGRYSLEGAIRQDMPAFWRKLLGDVADHEPIQAVLCDIENGHTSDYVVITRLELAPAPGEPHVLQYGYLKGSPIAGSSTYVVHEVTDPRELSRLGVERASRLEQIFEYQELTGDFANFFTRGGLKLHDQVVFSQVSQAAALAGGRVLESDIPAAYRDPK